MAPLPIEEVLIISLCLDTLPSVPAVELGLGGLTPVTGFDMVGVDGYARLIRGVMRAMNTAVIVGSTARYIYGCGGRSTAQY
ncbi:unnamed protein product [Urochloa humidicola]